MFSLAHSSNDALPPLVIFIGHAGSGKTSVAVALAKACATDGATDRLVSDSSVTLIDLDVVNPYFRSGDYEKTLTQAGVRLLLPQFSGVTNNLEVPSLPPHIDDAILQAGTLDSEGNPKRVILDVGGDDIGARVLGRYANAIAEQAFALYYVHNPYRYQTAALEGVRENLAELEQASALAVTGMFANPNLGRETTPALIAEGLRQSEALAQALALPLVGYAVDERFAVDFPRALPLSLTPPMLLD